VQQQEDAEAAAHHHFEVLGAERGYLALGADDVAQQRLPTEHPRGTEQRRQEQDDEQRLPSHAFHPFAIAFAALAAEHGGGGDGEAIADDGAERGQLITDADGTERGSCLSRFEVADQVGVDQVEHGLERHADRQWRAEAQHAARDRTFQDALLRVVVRRHCVVSRGSPFRMTGSRSRSKQSTGTPRFLRTSAVRRTNAAVTGS
jgi:hypothetical protein